MQLSTPIPASRLHPVFAQIVRTTQQAYGMPPAAPLPPEQVRELLGPTDDEHQSEAI